MNLDAAIERARSLPCWRDPQRLAPLEGGITNVNVRLRDGGRDYVVRIGDDLPEHGVMRFNELAISRAAAAAGVSPAVHYAEPGALVLDWVDARPLSGADLADRETLGAALDLLGRVHRDVTRAVAGPVLTFWVFHVIRDYARTLRRLDSPHVAELAPLLEEADRLEKAVGAIRPVLAHNDVLPANLLKGEKRLWLIDWEYGGFGSELFDLGGLASNAELDADTERWMLDAWFDGAPDAGTRRGYAAMKCASLLRETLWSMVSEKTSAIDFDYPAYTSTNRARYHAAFAGLDL